jgi:hypothetical protein
MLCVRQRTDPTYQERACTSQRAALFLYFAPSCSLSLTATPFISRINQILNQHNCNLFRPQTSDCDEYSELTMSSNDQQVQDEEQRSPLLDLPAELRLMVYEEHWEVIYRSSHLSHCTVTRSSLIGDTGHHTLSLLGLQPRIDNCSASCKRYCPKCGI